MKTIAIYYLRLYPVLSEAAIACGYALGIHGSLERDFDLIAVPWDQEATPAPVLIESLRAACSGHITEQVSDGGPWPRQKPHGRLAWSIQLGAGAYLDISVMPLTSPQ